MRRGLSPVVGRRITRIEKVRCRHKPITMRPSLAAIRRRITGRTIQAVERAGKRIVLCLDGGDRLLIHPRMAGLVLLHDPPDAEHLRLRIHLSGREARKLLYWDRRGLGTIELLDAKALAALNASGTLGPDALQTTTKSLRRRLAGSRRAIKVALLDQRAIAGIGNLYASEILHVARIHPECRCRQLTAAQWRRLHAAIIEVLQQAIDLEGSTLSDGTYRNALNQAGRYQNHHRVYQRTGQVCATCGDARIVRNVQSQRSTFFCPRCQKPPSG